MAGSPRAAVGSPPPIGRTRRKSLRQRAFVLPAILYLIAVTQAPFIVTVFYAFRSWNLLLPQRGQHWAGIGNFTGLAHAQPSLQQAIWQTILLTAATVLCAALIGLGLALLLKSPFPGRALVRTALITPMLVMPVATGIIWKALVFDTGSGILPWIAQQLGKYGFAPLSQDPMLVVIIISVWQWAPFAMVILLSGLSSMDLSAVEAARVDGAGTWQIFRRLILPHLSSYLSVVVLLGLILVLPTFGVIYVTTAGGPGYATTNLAYAVYQQGFTNYDIGAASALALTDAVFVIIALTGLMKIIGAKIIRGELLE